MTMAALWFVGVGLGDEQDVSRRAVAVLARCAHVFAEQYTAIWSPGAFERLSREIGRPIVELSRQEVEDERRILSALAEGSDVAFLAVGDPFSATTHLALRLAAENAGYPTRYLPNASILCAAAGVLGLIPYRFGRTVSLPFPEPGFAPSSPLGAIRSNREGGKHTLVLLDLRPAERRFLSASEALALLRERDPDGRALPPMTEVAVVARVGRADQRAWYGPLEQLVEIDFGPPLHALVVPAPELHFEEAEALGRLRLPRA